MSTSFPLLVVASAAAATSSKWPSSHSRKARMSRALSKLKTGARCIRSSRIVVVTPPASRHSFMPRLYDATNVPSVVASGTRKSPCACSPLTRSGPANPIGTCAAPKKLSTFPLSVEGSRE